VHRSGNTWRELTVTHLCIAFAILDIVSTWAAHTAGTLPSGRPPSLATQRNEMRLEQWWADLGHTWGLRRQSAAFQRPGNMPLSMLSNHSIQPSLPRHRESSRGPIDAEPVQVSRYDPRFGQPESVPYPLPTRHSYDGYAADGRPAHGRTAYARDAEDGEPLAHKKRRLSGGPARRPYDAAHLEPLTPYTPEQAPAPAARPSAQHSHSGLAALLTAAEHRQG
jgi:hypothetical protein